MIFLEGGMISPKLAPLELKTLFHHQTLPRKMQIMLGMSYQFLVLELSLLLKFCMGMVLLQC